MASLVTILFTDVVASSAIKRDASLGRDARERDRAYLERVQTRHFNLIRQCYNAHGGREVSTMGDAFYLTFDDPVAAVRCAVQIQKQLTDEPIETPLGPLRIRIGIHSGFPEFFEGGWHGTDVDTTARIESAASERQILLSSRTYELVRHMSDVKFHSRGQFELKGLGSVDLWEADWDGTGPRQTALLPSSLRNRRRRIRLSVAAGVVGASLFATVAVAYLRFERAPKLTSADTIVLADFRNTTGDPVFDETLRQGLAVQLEQSPFLSLASEERVHKALLLTGQPADAPLTPELAREVCARTGGTAVLEGSIAVLGSQYVLGLRARNCRTGDVLDDEQAQAARKEDVLNALTQIASKFRTRAGESLATVEKHDTPLAEATTPSLEALKAYSSGVKTVFISAAAAMPYFKRATEIDPKFAMAYAYLGRVYGDLEDPALSAESTRKAYQLRDRASDQERFFIAASYDLQVTGNLEKAQQTCEAWAQAYPRELMAPRFLGLIYSVSGQYEKAIEQTRKSVERDPDFGLGYFFIADEYQRLDRLEGAENTLRRASERRLEIPEFVELRYDIAFLKGDRAGMERELAVAKGKSGPGNWKSGHDAFVLAYEGHLQQARRTLRGAVDLALPVSRDKAGLYAIPEALWESFFGNTAEASRSARAALKISRELYVEYGAAFALARSGDSSESQRLAADLERRFPEDTGVRCSYLPVLRASLALNKGEPAKAVELLEAAIPYELGMPRSAIHGNFGALYPAYVRGEAYLAARQGAKAASEFEKILDHRGIVVSDPIGALAHLQLGRAFLLAGDQAKAKAAYQNFLALWKDADPDIPILIAARKEYGALR